MEKQKKHTKKLFFINDENEIRTDHFCIAHGDKWVSEQLTDEQLYIVSYDYICVVNDDHHNDDNYNNHDDEDDDNIVNEKLLMMTLTMMMMMMIKMTMAMTLMITTMTMILAVTMTIKEFNSPIIRAIDNPMADHNE